MRALLVLSLVLSGAGSPDFDLVLANGKVVDGTGAPWFRGDVGVKGDKIVAIGDLSASSTVRRIDVSGKTIAPGFIDMLGQSELMLLVDNRAESKIRQGITTEITGEGRSIAPTSDALIAELKPFLTKHHLEIDWRDLTGFAERLERSKSAVNLATLIGGTTVRSLVLGLGDRQPSPGELTQMKAIVERGMAQGALGVSSALTYPPATFATTSELIALATTSARSGGIYATHLRSEADGQAEALEEAIAIGRAAKIPVEIWHLKVAGRNNWGTMNQLVRRIQAAREEGVDISANMYPYAAAMNTLSSSLPAWAQIGGREPMLARLKDPAQRERMKKDLWTGGLGTESPDDIQLVLALNPAVKPFLGKRLSQVAKELGKSPEDALLDLLLMGDGRIAVIRHVMSEEDVQLGLRQSWVSIGTDAGGQGIDGPFGEERGHPRGFGTTARVLGHYSRDLGLFTIEEAVRKMTSLPASRARLFDRGLIKPGMATDLVVFDANKVRDLATYDDPNHFPEGFDTVVVNGKVTLHAGKLTGERAGRFLKHGR